jgi:hypothetical protein
MNHVFSPSKFASVRHQLWVYLCLSLVSGCVGDPVTPDAKYTFTEFESIESVSNMNLSGWEVIDARSIVVHTGPSDYYLLILGHAMSDLHSAETILLTSTGNRIEARFDCVEIVEPSCSPRSTPAIISTIYKLKDSSSISYVRDKIRNH